jgi:hypothetical protein
MFRHNFLPGDTNEVFRLVYQTIYYSHRPVIPSINLTRYLEKKSPIALATSCGAVRSIPKWSSLGNTFVSQ